MQKDPPARDGEGLRLADLIASLSLATDLANAFPLEKTLRTCLLAVHLGRAVGLDAHGLADLYYAVLIRFIGCTSFAHEEAALFGGDDRAMHALYAPLDFGQPRQMVQATVLHLAEGAPPLARAGAVANFLLKGPRLARLMVSTHCEVADRLAERLGMPAGVRRVLAQVFERWDGKGDPSGLAGEQLDVATRIVHVAHHAEIAHRVGGPDAAVELVRQRGGGQFDPAIAALFVDQSAVLLGALDQSSVWDAVLAADPAPHRLIPAWRLDDAAGAFADFVDLKSPYTLGHSRGVAAVAEAAARQLDLDEADVRRLRLAALLHDVGRVSVPNGVWDKPGRLNAAEWERVRLHPYYTERVLAQSPLLRDLVRIAGAHHERLDGAGYHRGSPAAMLPLTARVLAAADAYHAMIEDRPYRPALSPAAAAGELRRDVAARRLDPEAVQAVLAATGQAAKTPRSWPAGLSDREVDVLRLLARGQSNKQIAQQLVISDKTVHVHVLHIYEKIGASTRAGAALFAAEHGLVPPGTPSGVS